MQPSVLIFDNVLPDPHGVREVAKRLDYPDVEGTNFPGRNSAQRITTDELDRRIEAAIGERISPMPGQAHGKFRLTLASDAGKAGVHIDDSQWSGILYLSTNDVCEGGTDFFRHKRTGTDNLLMSRQQMAELGWTPETMNDEVRKILATDTLSPEAWELTMRVPMVFNRLLLFRPWFWHTAGPGFGSTFDDGRLVLLLFYAAEGVTRAG